MKIYLSTPFYYFDTVKICGNTLHTPHYSNAAQWTYKLQIVKRNFQNLISSKSAEIKYLAFGFKIVF